MRSITTYNRLNKTAKPKSPLAVVGMSSDWLTDNELQGSGLAVVLLPVNE